ncbi:MAG: PAS domain S-box protein [Chthoniobacter sp.]|nr:PAS domain S-box protein [Chthoniobacter sp.]
MNDLKKPEKTGPRVRIIHLEDNLLDRELVSAMLETNGIDCDIVYAQDRDSFRAVLELEDVDLIISDFSLPGYDGGRALEIARQLREEVPFIFFSGTLGEEAAVESLKNGATDYILKQRPERLVAAVRRALKDAAGRRARERMAEELRQRDGLLRNIMENVEDLVSVVDLTGRLILSSPSHRKLFGMASPAVGSDFLAHVHPHDQERIKSLFECAIEEGSSRAVEYRLQLPDNSTRFLEAQAKIMFDESGEKQGVLWVARDITERRLAEQQILEQAALLDEARDAICVNDLDQRILFWNKSAERLYGWTSNEAIGRNANQLLCQDQVALVALKTLIQCGEWNGELHQTTRAGLHLVVASRWTLIRDDAGAPKSILVINTDITENKKAEQKIEEQAALLDKARDAILVCDLNQSVVYWNEGASRLYGWAPEEAVGRQVEELLFGKAPSEWSGIRRALDEKGEWIGELRQRTRHGRELVVQCRQTLVRDASGNPTSVLYINSDMTEQKKIEAQFLRTQRMESIGALAGGIAHDLNNVLGPIMMAVEVIQNDPRNPANAGLLELVGSSAKRGSELVKQILSFARGIDGQKTMLKIPQLVGEVVKLATDTFPRDITVRSKLTEDLPAVQGDATQVHQILLNLFVNARDAMPKGGNLGIEARTIVLNKHSTKFHREPLSGRFVEIKVSDTGTGIPADVLPKIFEPFFTTKDPGKGTGLGLSTVLGIVKAHGGFVEVATEAGKGTTFSIYLAAIETTPAGPEPAEAGEPMHGRNEEILIVDDEAAILEITRETLAAYNYRVLATSSGEEAVSLFARHHTEIDLVITDMLMPGMDGPTLIRTLRKVKPGVRLIAVSGVASNVPQLETQGFLKKPFSTAALLRSVRSALDS